jgi:hypothetical protein
MAETGSTSRKLLWPAISALVLLVIFSALFYFREQVFDALAKSTASSFHSLSDWIPKHTTELTVILITLAICIAVDWVAHIVGRLRPWIFVVVFQIGVWILFWNTFIGESGKDSLGIDSLKSANLSVKEQAISMLFILVVSGIVFWILEAKENWNRYRHSQSTDGD